MLCEHTQDFSDLGRNTLVDFLAVYRGKAEFVARVFFAVELKSPIIESSEKIAS